MGVEDDGLTAAEGLAIMRQHGYVTRGPSLERIECEHDFHTGNAPCTKCKKTMSECGIKHAEEPLMITSIDEVDLDHVSMSEDGSKFSIHGTVLRSHTRPMTEHEKRYPAGWNRADEVAYPYGLKRIAGEHDAALLTRVRIHCANPHVKRHVPPAWDWVPPLPPTRARAPFAEEFVVDPETGATKRVT